MADGVFKDIHAKESVIEKLWTTESRAGDETAPDIHMSGAHIKIGRQTSTGSHTTLTLRSKSGGAGVVWNPGQEQIVMDDTQVPTSGNANIIFQLNSTTKGLVIPRMTTAQANTLSGSLVSSNISGAVVFNTVLNKLEVWNGAQWETVTSVAR